MTYYVKTFYVYLLLSIFSYIKNIQQIGFKKRKYHYKILRKLNLQYYANAIITFKDNPEKFIEKVSKLIKKQKATMIVEHISYNQIEGGYDSTIFTAEKSIEDLDSAQEVCVYAKLPKGFHIPTPAGNYSPDWAIAFYEGTVKHIFFVAETKGTMDSLNLRPIEKAKIDCAKKLFATISTGMVKYDHVDSFQQLMNKVMQ